MRNAQRLHHGYALVCELGRVRGPEDHALTDHLFLLVAGRRGRRRRRNLVAADVAEIGEPRGGDEGWRGEDEAADRGRRGRAGELAWVGGAGAGAGAGAGGGDRGLDTHFVGWDEVVVTRVGGRSWEL